MALRNPQRNDVFTAIQDAGLSPEEFEFEWDAGVDKSSFRHVPSGACFVVCGVAGNYSSWYSAGDEPVEERKALSWYGLAQHVGFWLAAVRRDIDTPDLWA